MLARHKVSAYPPLKKLPSGANPFVFKATRGVVYFYSASVVTHDRRSGSKKSKIDQITIKYTLYTNDIKIPNDHKKYPNFPFQGLKNEYQDWDFWHADMYTIWRSC
jgi:hypothetical protein